MKLESIFKVEKPVIGMLHLDYLKGQHKEYRGWNYLLSKATTDFYNLVDGRIDGILVENWKEDTIGEKANPENVESIKNVIKHLPGVSIDERECNHVPLGVNVLNNDYQASFDIAKELGADFVQLDTFVDHVQTKYDFSPSAKEQPFEIKPNPKEIIEYRRKIGAEDVALFASIQPKHYRMLEFPKSIESSARQAIENGADAIVVTGTKTGYTPTTKKISRVRKAANDMNVDILIGLGSGFSRENAAEYFPMIDFVIVGTDLKYENKTDNPVDRDRVAELMKIVKKMR